jgi:hypothetical protein
MIAITGVPMRLSTPLLALVTMSALASVGALAAEDASFSKDLTATIVLQGLPCDKVASSQRNGDSDYTATCRDGNRYHVYVDSSGRVVVKKL